MQLSSPSNMCVKAVRERHPNIYEFIIYSAILVHYLSEEKSKD